MRAWSVALLLASVVACGQGDERGERVGDDALPITSGDLDLGDPAVVQLTGGLGTCTGTLVAPQVVLTAAHCLGPPCPTEVLFGGGSDAGAVSIAVDDCRAHPAFDAETVANDIAVVHLVSAAPTTPVSYAEAPLDPSIVDGVVRIVGFGSDGSDEHPVNIKREGTAALTSLAPTTFSIAPDPSLTCIGDSGGPAFLRVSGVEMLVGVTSMGDGLCRSDAIDTRVDANAGSFITPYIEAHEHVSTQTSGCAVMSPNLSQSSNEGPIVILVLSTIAFRRRRRSQ